MSLFSDEKLVIDVLGWVGAAILVVAYFLVSHGRWSGSSLKYNACNIGASIMLGINAYYYGAKPSFGVNVVWLLVGLNALRLLWTRR